MEKDMDAQFLCKDCARFNQCEYYDRRKEDSYICKYFHLTETYGMTNGEVIQAVFPNATVEYLEYSNYIHIADGIGFKINRSWWNATYQKGGE